MLLERWGWVISIIVNWNSTNYSIPEAQEVGWASLTNFLVALGTYAQTTGAQQGEVRVATTTPVTVSNTDFAVITNMGVASAVTVNLPAGVEGRMFAILDGKLDAQTNNITVNANGAETINGSSSYVINANGGGVLLIYNTANTRWNILATFDPNALTRTSTDTGANRVFNKDFDDDTTGIVDSGDTTKRLEFETSGSSTSTTTTISTASTASRTLSLPDVSSALIARTSTDTGANRLQNKDLDDDTTGIVDSGDTTKRLEFETAGQTTATTTTIATTSTASRTISLPDVTSSILARTSTDTGANRVQNKDLDDDSVKFVDSGDTSKALEFELASQSTSTTTTIATSSTASRTITIPDATTTMVGTDTTQQLTNKDYDGGTASNSLRLTLPKNTTTNLNALTRKEATIVYDTDTDTVKYDNGSNLVELLTGASVQDSISFANNLSLSASVGSSALTVNLLDKSGATPSVGSPVSIGFRSATSATGTYSVRTVTGALSIVVSSGSTLGQISATADYLYIYAIDNAGTVELAISSTIYDEGSIVSTTAEGGAGGADSRTTIYSTTARSNVPLRLIGRLYQSQATAGTWASTPTEVATGLQLIQPRMDDIHATQAGRKTYFHGTNYNGGIAPTVGGDATSVTVAGFIPYQMQDGSWRMKFYIRCAFATSWTSRTVSVNGITTPAYPQAITGYNDVGGSAITRVVMNASTNTFTIVTTTAATGDAYFFGDIQLASKPTWAY